MRYRIATVLLLAVLGGCSSPDNSRNFSIFFPPYSADLDQPAQDTVHAAAAFAKDHPFQPVVVIGYAAPPDPGKDVPGLSDTRADAVKAIMVGDGVAGSRISVSAKGVTDPGLMPTISVRRVDIQVGTPPAEK